MSDDWGRGDIFAARADVRSHRWITVLVAACAGVLVLMVLGASVFAVYMWPSVADKLFLPGLTDSEQPLPAAVPAKATIAIAPFANQSPDADYDWLGYAFAYAMVSRLVNFPELLIAGPEKICQALADKQSDLTLSDMTTPTVAQQAGEAVRADYVIIGSFTKLGDEIGVTAQIVDVATSNIHSERVGRREYTKIFDLHAELVMWAAETLDVTAYPPKLERIKYKPTESMSAYECLGQGLMHYYRGDCEAAIVACQKALDIDSNFADAYVVLAWALGCQEKYDEAIAQLKKVEKLDPERPYLHYNLGIAYQENEDYNKAVAELREAVRRHSSDPRVRRWLGDAYHSRYQYEQAVVHYNEAIQLRPNWALPHWNIAGAYEHLGREDKEIEEYKEALRLCKPGESTLRAKAHYNLGTTYLNNGQVDEAVAHLQKACELDPDFAEAFNNLGIAYRMKGQREKAITEYEKALDLYESPRQQASAHHGLGFNYRQLGRLDKALEHFGKQIELLEQCIDKRTKQRVQALLRRRFEDALDEQWELHSLRYNLSGAYSSLALTQDDMGDYEAVIESSTKALELDQDNNYAYWARASGYADKWEYKRALADWTSCLQLLPERDRDYVGALSNRGTVHRHLGDYEKALADQNRALEIDPSRGCAYGNRARTYYDMGDYERARADADTALEKCGSCPGGYVVRGLLHAKEQDYEQAIAEYEKALEVGCPRDDLYTYYQLAVVYKDLGKFSAAREYAQKTLEAFPEHKEAKELLAELDRLVE